MYAYNSTQCASSLPGLIKLPALKRLFVDVRKIRRSLEKLKRVDQKIIALMREEIAFTEEKFAV